MIQLADEFFHVKNDPSQLSIDESVMEQLRALHRSAIQEQTNENGPIAWLIVIPTTKSVMEQFLSGAIGEREILEQTLPGGCYDALYLCSVLLLPEYRGKGIARNLCREAIRSILADHPVRSFFGWAFSPEGRRLAQALAEEFAMPLKWRAAETAP